MMITKRVIKKEMFLKVKDRDSYVFAPDIKIVNVGDEIELLYGGEMFEISLEEVTALLSGKCLYFTVNDEYACVVKIAE